MRDSNSPELEVYTDLDVQDLIEIESDYIDIDLSSDDLETALIRSLGIERKTDG